jgi:hypothetical protein
MMSIRNVFAVAVATAFSALPLLGLAQTPAPAQSAAPAPLKPADAAALVGDWNISATGPNGPATFLLTLKVADQKVVGEISSDAMAKTPITDIVKSGTAVVLNYSFDYQGMAVPSVITLTPDGETLAVVIDFAQGAYTMNGKATRKKG